jgi:hypothetical protein
MGYAMENHAYLSGAGSSACFAKVGVSRQSELAALLTKLVLR